MATITRPSAASVAAAAVRTTCTMHPGMTLQAAEMVLARIVCEAITNMDEDRLIHEQAAEAYYSAGVQELLPPWDANGG